MKKQKLLPKSNEQWVVLELDKGDKFPIVFGPFVLYANAVDFCNRRIHMLAGEWDKSDGIITDFLQWKLEKCCVIDEKS